MNLYTLMRTAIAPTYFLIASLCGCLSAPVFAQITNSPGPAFLAGLVTLRRMPDPESMKDIRIPALDPGVPPAIARLSVCRKPDLGDESFRRLMAGAKPIPATHPGIVAFHYAPWCRVEFTDRTGKNTVQLFQGGRGVLTQPNGERGMFEFAYPNVAMR